MKLLKTDGVVIKKVDHSEADRSLTIFTKYYGLININIKGIRKSKKRHLNGADFFSVSNFIFYKKEEYYILSSFELTETFMDIRQDLDKINISFYILEVINSILVENETRVNLFKLLVNSFKFLDKNKLPIKNYLLICYFLITLINEEGISFQIKKGNYFDIENSIISTTVAPYKLTKLEKKIIIHLLNKEISIIQSFKPSTTEIKKLISVLEIYINYHLNTKINFKKFF